MEVKNSASSGSPSWLLKSEPAPSLICYVP